MFKSNPTIYENKYVRLSYGGGLVIEEKSGDDCSPVAMVYDIDNQEVINAIILQYQFNMSNWESRDIFQKVTEYFEKVLDIE